MTLSAIVIAKNAAEKILDCLRSVQFAEETIVVDAGSIDDTIQIARDGNARIVRTKDKGYAHSRNLGVKQAKGEWLLYVDSDERVSEKLREVILTKIREQRQQISSYKIQRKNVILGKWLRHGGWWPDPVHRLLKKSAFVRWEGRLHEYPIVNGQVGLISEPIVHQSKDSISEMVENSKRFSKIEAELLLTAGHPPVGIHHFLLAMWREFWRRGVVGLAWLDGTVGVIELVFQIYHQVFIYSNLWQLQQKQKARSEKQ